MKTRRLFRGLIAVLLTMVISIFIINCIPPSTATTEGDESVISAEKARQDSLRNLDCERYLSFAYSYYQNQNWSGAISNFKKMVDLGCDEDYARDIFAYYGRSYQQLAKEDPVYYDSALFVYIEGEKYLPDNEFLHKNMAYIYHIQGKVDLELREYEKLVDINPDDIELYRNLVKLYFSSEKYEDALWPIEEILRIDPNDEQAVNDRMIAFDRMGKDIIDVQREQWEKNPDNIRYGMEYAFSLQDRLEYESAIEVYKRIAAIDNGNREVWENLGRLYTALDRTEDAMKSYLHINKNIDPKDIATIQQIVKGYLHKEDFPNALLWSEKAVDQGNQSLAYKIRAEVYYTGAEYCVGDRKMNFEDKLVYKLAYDDYKKAFASGDQSVKSRIDFLKSYLVPTVEDWFMNKDDEKGNPRRVFKPRGECYSWIKTDVKKD